MATEISVLAELERMGMSYVPKGDEWVRICCCFHDDHEASCDINTKSGGWKCHACGAHGDLVKLMAAATKSDRHTVGVYLARTYGLEKVKTVEPEVVERMHAAVWEHKHLLRELYDRGVQDDDIRRYRIGVHAEKGRVSIPVKNEAGLYVNVRYYLPGAPGGKKMQNAAGRGEMRLFPADQLDYGDVVICGGEVKAIVAARVLNPHGIGAVCATGGEGNWHHDFTRRLAGKKRVWVCMDVDEAGRRAALARAAQMYPVSEWVGIVDLPLDRDKYSKGDLNDFVGREGGDLLKLMLATSQWAPSAKVTDPDEEPTRVKFSETVHSRNVRRRMLFSGVVAAAREETYVIPRRVVVTCTKDQEQCAHCAVHPCKDNVFHVAPESPAILEMINAKKGQMDDATRAALGIPKRCAVVQLDITDFFNVEDVRVNPSLEITNRDTQRTLQSAVCVDCEAALNGTYEFTGRMYPHPNSQQATLVIGRSAATHDALDRHVPRDTQRLRVFRPAEWTQESLAERLDDIYADLEANVTRVFMRRDVHLFMDLAYHSVLLLTVDGKTTKGWTEVLVMGDSSQGKSEVMKTLMAHYQLGEEVDCKNASAAGLIGGLAEINGAWMVQWGVIPTNDRKIVFMEEACGMGTPVIASLTGMRSSGRAELTKISKRKTHARTRLGWISNCRNDRTMATYNFGVEAVRDLMGAPQDVRRLDAALIVSSGEIDPRALNDMVRDPPAARHRYTSALCNELVLWAWTRKQEEVVVDDNAAAYVAEQASLLAEEYSDQIPLVDKGSTRHKLTRLSAALACRTFSTGEDETVARVRLCHAQHVVGTLRRVYSSATFGYKFFSEAERTVAHLMDPDLLKARLEMLPHCDEAKKSLLYSDTLDLTDLQDWFAWDRSEAQDFLSLLVRKRGVRRLDRKYVKTPEFIEFLKTVELTPRPPHLGPEKF